MLSNLTRTALHFACVRENLEITKALCVAGANPNVCDNKGATPLHKVYNSYTIIVHVLLTTLY